MKAKMSTPPENDASLPVKRAPNGILYLSYRPGVTGDAVRQHFTRKFGYEPREVFVNSIDSSVRAGPVGVGGQPPAASPEPAAGSAVQSTATAEPETESSSIAVQQLELL